MNTNSKGSGLFWRASGIALGMACLAMGPRSAAGATPATPAPPLIGQTQTIDLEYRELGYGVLNWGLDVRVQKEHFQKEPAVSQSGVVRGQLFGNLGADGALPFLWDTTQGKLLLDLNRNGDLTDDKEGVFACGKPIQSSYQFFNNVHLSFKTDSTNHPALVDLTLYNYGVSPSGYVAFRSLWAGKISLQGHDYEIGVIENRIAGQSAPLDDGYLLLRPLDRRAQSFSLEDGLLEAFAFAHNLFFNGQGYRLECSFLPQSTPPKYRLRIEERTPELADLHLAGKFVSRLVLNPEPGRAGYMVVLDAPESRVKVPVGVYSRHRVVLDADGAKASPIETYSSRSLTVSDARPAQLADGGPLTNAVTLSRSGSMLTLNYELLGAHGKRYRLLGLRQEPEFTIYHGERKVASGKFEFG